MDNSVISMESVAKSLNDATYTDYFYRLMMIARTRFEWDNLPDGIDEKWIERYLFSEGRCVFFKDEKMGFMVAKCTDNGKLNAYDESIYIRPYATGYTHKAIENHVDCVVIGNNDLWLPTTRTIQLFALRLAEATRTIDVNINAMKTPKIILCDEKKMFSLKRLFKKVDDNETKIFGVKDLDLESVKALDVEAPIVFDKLQNHKHMIWNEVMSFLGIDNANMDKKERLVTDEVQANNEQVDISASVMLKAREQACEEINKLFNLNISVRLREIKKPELESSEEVQEDVL